MKIIAFNGDDSTGKTFLSSLLFLRNPDLIIFFKDNLLFKKEEWFSGKTESICFKIVSQYNEKLSNSKKTSKILILDKGMGEIKRRMNALSSFKGEQKNYFDTIWDKTIKKFKINEKNEVSILLLPYKGNVSYFLDDSYLKYKKCYNSLNFNYNEKYKIVNKKQKLLNTLDLIEEIIINEFNIKKQTKVNQNQYIQNSIYRKVVKKTNILIKEQKDHSFQEFVKFLNDEFKNFKYLITGSNLFNSSNENSDLDVILIFFDKNNYKKALNTNFSKFTKIGINLVYSKYILLETSKNQIYFSIYNTKKLDEKLFVKNSFNILQYLILLSKSKMSKNKDISEKEINLLIKLFFNLFLIFPLTNDEIWNFISLYSCEKINKESKLSDIILFLETEMYKLKEIYN